MPASLVVDQVTIVQVLNHVLTANVRTLVKLPMLAVKTHCVGYQSIALFAYAQMDIKVNQVQLVLHMNAEKMKIVKSINVVVLMVHVKIHV